MSKRVKSEMHGFFGEERGKELLKRVEHQKNSSGVTNIKKYYSGKNISLKQAVLANCAECMGFYVDGMTDCEQVSCPLYYWMPYRAGRKKYTRPDRLI